MKRIGILCLAFALCAGLFCSCQKAEPNANKSVDSKIHIVCTVFPPYDWVREILGEEADRFEVTLLLDNGVDLHSYSPTAQDIVKVTNSDLFIYVGGESDGWVEDALKQGNGSQVKTINLCSVMGEALKEEEIVEGMQAEEHEEEAAKEAPEYDEHVWLSLKNADRLVAVIAEAVEALDTQHAAIYQANATAYQSKLEELEQQYQALVNHAKRKTLLFGDRFPFRYLADDYGLTYYAAFVGCSAESEASFETIAFLSKKVEELSIPYVLVIENSDQKIAQSVIANSSRPDTSILVMNSLQSVTSKEVAEGTSYLSIMKENMGILEKALN